MADTETRTTDAKGRVTLPRGFANTPVIVERVSDTEIRIRKAVVIPQEDLHFIEESSVPLSDGDRDRFLGLLDNPPRPNRTLKKAARALKHPDRR